MQPITDYIIQEIKSRIVNAVHPEKIILFGSCAYGTPTKDTDVDLLVIMPSNEPMHKRIFRIKKLLRDFRFPKDVIVYTPQEVNDWKDVSNAFITSIIKNGKSFMDYKDLAIKWLDKGNSDLIAGKYILSMLDPPSDIICFHSQQAVEKYLKGFLAFHKLEIPRTHELEELSKYLTYINLS